MNKYFSLIFKGFLIGSADMVPGISGGTIALLVGIYERLIKALSALKLKFIIDILSAKKEKIINVIREIDFALFVPLGLGILGAIVITPRLINWLLSNYPAGFYSLLFGLIWGSLIPLTKNIKPRFSNFLLLVIGFSLSFWFVGLNTFSLGHGQVIIFLAGLLAFCAMILPGVSGSFVLLALNQYEYMLLALREIRLKEIFIFLLGGALGLLFFSKIINIFIKKYHLPTIIFLVGLMLGSLRLPAELVIINYKSIFEVILPLMLGFLSILYLENKFRVI